MTFWLADRRVADLARTALELERLLSIRKKHLDLKIRRAPKSSRKREDLLGEWVDVHEWMSQDIRYALFLALYAQFEQALYSICEDVRERRVIAVSVSDMVGQGVRRYQLYFKKVLEMSFPDDAREWQRILSLGEIRNYLVHKTRWVSARETQGRILEILSRERYLAFDMPGPIQFKRAFIGNVAVIFVGFLQELAYRTGYDGLGPCDQRLSLKKVKAQIRRGEQPRR